MSPVSASDQSLRVVTWNILEADRDREERLSQVAAALEPKRPDVLCLQESWPGAASALASRLGMRVAAAAFPDGSTHVQNAILTRHPADIEMPSESISLDGWDDQNYRRGAVAARIVSPSGRSWRITTAHLAWGSKSEGTRLGQVRQLDELAEAVSGRHARMAQVLCGDFNTLPDSATLRYLTGLDPASDGSSTQWVDAWKVTRPDELGITSDPENPHAAATAASVGILDVARLPKRRIDFMLVRGYAYGRPGSPLHTELVGTGADGAGVPSDHYGILADLWDPPEERRNSY